MLAFIGCHPIFHFDGGFTDAFSERQGRVGGAANAHVGMHTGEGANGVIAGGGIAIRSRLAGDLFQFSLAEEFFVMPFSKIEIITPFFRGGFNVYQFESLDDSFAYGMFSPYAEAGLLVRLTQDGTDTTFLSFTGLVEHDVRFTHQPNESYWMGLIGFGFSTTYQDHYCGGEPTDDDPDQAPTVQ